MRMNMRQVSSVNFCIGHKTVTQDSSCVIKYLTTSRYKCRVTIMQDSSYVDIVINLSHHISILSIDQRNLF